jgi:hypothetical protein
VPSDWRARVAGIQRQILSVAFTGSAAALGLGGPGPADPGPDAVTYLGVYHQVRSAYAPNYPAVPFADYLLT